MAKTSALCAATLLATALSQPIQPADPKCAKLTAGAWSVTADATATDCATAGGQWILNFPQTGYPDHHPLPKTWWMKRVADTGVADTVADMHDRLYFGGTPSERDMKLLYEAGVDAVLSMTTTTTVGAMGVMPLPTTAEATATAAEAGMLYHTLTVADYTTTEGVDEIAAFMDFALANTGQASSGNGPILVHDAAGFDAVGALQLYRARKGFITAADGSSVTAKAIAEAEHHGYKPSAALIAAIAREAGETYNAATMVPLMSDVASTTATTAMTSYHWLKYLYNIGPVGIFDAGQIQKFHVQALYDAGVRVVINMRQGQTVSGAWAAAAQEPINLLNVGFGGSSKNIGGTGASAWLAANPTVTGSPAGVIAAERPASWVCQYPAILDYTTYTDCVTNTGTNSTSNFEQMNSLEWGDAIGQNTQAEGVDIEAAGMTYMHLPVGAMMDPPVPFNAATFLQYSDQFISAVNTARAAGGHVLFHCTIGYRTGAFPTGLKGVITETDSTPQLTQAEMNAMMHGWGYDADDEQTGHVFEVGTNTMFPALSTLKFTGSVDWTTGTIDGSVALRDNDCAGSWSACTTACEAAADRVWSLTTAQTGAGEACPAATACGNGDGACVVTATPATPPPSTSGALMTAPAVFALVAATLFA